MIIVMRGGSDMLPVLVMLVMIIMMAMIMAAPTAGGRR